MLQRLETWLGKNHPSYYRVLQPGLGDAPIAAVRGAHEALGAVGPALDELLELYRWRNGQPYAELTSFFESRDFLSADAGLIERKTNLELLDGGDFESPGW